MRGGWGERKNFTHLYLRTRADSEVRRLSSDSPIPARAMSLLPDLT